MSNSNEVILTGLDGSNPLAFLAALGTLRTLSLAERGGSVRLTWRRLQCWVPVLVFEEKTDEENLLAQLEGQLAGTQDRDHFRELGDDLTVDASKFRALVLTAALSCTRTDRTVVDFVAAFGSETTVNDNGNIQDTALRTMSGAGHQHFLGFMRNIIAATEHFHLQKALFEGWKYDDPVQNLTLRWDPIDDVRYALRWRNPSGDPSRRQSGSVLGANRLAIEGLPLFVTVPAGSKLLTTGFKGTRSYDTFWTWPIWGAPIGVEAVRSLLSLPILQSRDPDRVALEQLGVAEVYRSQRLTIGKVRNFAPSRAV